MKLFNSGTMSTLFCTSTIVEGVNTNAKTVVIYSNPSGKTDEGRKFLLLNINGRAGRYQHHFIGNIVYLTDKSIKLINCSGIALDFKLYSTQILSDLDLENVDDEDLSFNNKTRKAALKFNKQLLPDDVFEQNRLIERKKQERILSIILDRVESFIGIEKASIEDFIYRDYFETILNIWSEIGEIKPTQVKAIKSFSINYAKNSYRGVLEYGFSQYDSQTDEHKFANELLGSRKSRIFPGGRSVEKLHSEMCKAREIFGEKLLRGKRICIHAQLRRVGDTLSAGVRMGCLDRRCWMAGAALNASFRIYRRYKVFEGMLSLF